MIILTVYGKPTTAGVPAEGEFMNKTLEYVFHKQDKFYEELMYYHSLVEKSTTCDFEPIKYNINVIENEWKEITKVYGTPVGRQSKDIFCNILFLKAEIEKRENQYLGTTSTEAATKYMEYKNTTNTITQNVLNLFKTFN